MMKADFLQTRPTLQLLDYDTVFAAGDVTQIANNERPKAGVFAVRAVEFWPEILGHYWQANSFIIIAHNNAILRLSGLKQTGNCHPWQVFSKRPDGSGR